MRKAIVCGLAPGNDGELAPARFTRRGAQWWADAHAAKTGMRGAAGVVTDCGTHWRVNIGAQREERS